MKLIYKIQKCGEMAALTGKPRNPEIDDNLLHIMRQEGRFLSKNEHVDHVDNNQMNDFIWNLQILSPLENTRKQNRKRRKVEMICPSCFESFVRNHNKTHLIKGSGYTSCSRSCAAKSQRHIELNGLQEYRDLIGLFQVVKEFRE